MDFVDILNELGEHMSGFDWTLIGLVKSPDLTGFSEQETEMPLLPVEYVKHRGNEASGHYGTILFPTTYPDADGGVMYIRIEYTD